MSSMMPIVVAIVSDPVEEGFAKSYARPGGNITGVAFQDAELITKFRAGSPGGWTRTRRPCVLSRAF